MESNKIAILDNKLPIKAYPEQKLEEILKTVFKFWLSSLLSIKADNEEKLDLSLVAVKKHFWSLGINEIKIAFEMYADGQLTTKPISNHIDRILVGQIFNEYRQQKPVVKKEIPPIAMSEEERKQIIIVGLLDCFETYIESKEVSDFRFNVFDVLLDIGLLPTINFSEKVKKAYEEKRIQAQKELKYEIKIDISNEPKKHLREELNIILEDVNNGLSSKIDCRVKSLVLKGYFKKMIDSQENPKDYFISLLNEKYDKI